MNNHGHLSTPGPFQGLNPERILETVESALGITCSNLCRSYNSYINRVFEIADTNGNGMVVKFYRPGRWSPVALQDEHDFLLELAEEEIPVLAPLPLHNGQTLGQSGNVHFAVFSKKGGRLIDEFNDELWLAIGRLLGRMHMVGARKMPRDRVRMHPAQSTASQVDFICRSGLLPADLMSAYTTLTGQLIELIKPLFEHTEMIRIHGDCHSGNLIHRPGESLYVLDFDDMVVGPPIQDVWMLLPGTPEESVVELNLFMEGYETFRPFDHSSLRLIEPLRAMRFIHYSAWCAHQVVEDGETAVINDFATRSYWQKELDDLEDQLQRIEHPHQLDDFSREIF
ncbi:MAG: serine/threonine protein kinase [Desulfobulbus sp.]|nr:serine/threonine protein kinase [Desulfobulbus sp.]